MRQSIPFVDLRRQYKSIKGEIKTAMQRIIDTSGFTLNEEVELFDNVFIEPNVVFADDPHPMKCPKYKDRCQFHHLTRSNYRQKQLDGCWVCGG